MNFHPVAEELYHAGTQRDGRTDRHKFANRPLSQVCKRA